MCSTAVVCWCAIFWWGSMLCAVLFLLWFRCVGVQYFVSVLALIVVSGQCAVLLWFDGVAGSAQ